MKNRVIAILVEGTTRQKVALHINSPALLQGKVSIITSVVDGKLRLFLHKTEGADPQEAFEIMENVIAYLKILGLLDYHNLYRELTV